MDENAVSSDGRELEACSGASFSTAPSTSLRPVSLSTCHSWNEDRIEETITRGKS